MVGGLAGCEETALGHLYLTMPGSLGTFQRRLGPVWVWSPEGMTRATCPACGATRPRVGNRVRQV